MSVFNSGPQRSSHGGHGSAVGSRRSNPTPVLRDELTDEVTAASGRASTVTHRFGGVRYALTRPTNRPATPIAPTMPATDRRPRPEEGDSDARE